MKVTYVPDDESLTDDLMHSLWNEDGLRMKVLDILNTLRSAGYTVSREVEVTGPLADALAWVDAGKPRSVTIKTGRPKRRTENEK